jgi:hypothetical protein
MALNQLIGQNLTKGSIDLYPFLKPQMEDLRFQLKEIKKKTPPENDPCYFFLLKTGITGPTAGYFHHFDLLLT